MSNRNFVFPPAEGGDYRILLLEPEGTMRMNDGFPGFTRYSEARRFIVDNPEIFLGTRFAVVRFHEIGRMDEEITKTVRIISREKHAAEVQHDEADGPRDDSEAEGSS
jgi:hypothetical protein